MFLAVKDSAETNIVCAIHRHHGEKFSKRPPIVDKAVPWRKKLSLVADLILNLNLIPGRAMVFVLFVVTKL